MSEKTRVKKILSLLESEYPKVPGTALKHKNPFQLLISTILSAQCTDKQVNRVTKKLFKKYPTAKDLASVNLKEIEDIVKQTGFYHNKAKFIKKASKQIHEDYDGKVPREISELIKIMGVGRKTANVVLSNAFNINQGVAVDTHVKRLSNRLGFTDHYDPDKIEKDLTNLFPKDDWGKLNSLLITHGRKICTARNPDCENCVLSKLCPSAFNFD